MAYVASVKRLRPMLEHPQAKVLVAVSTQPYADTLLKAILTRIDEAVEPWTGARLYLLAGRVEMPNGAELHICAVEDLETARLGAGHEWTYFLYSMQLDEDVKQFLLGLTRAPATYTGTVGSEQFEQEVENPLEQPKEPDDTDLL